MPSKSPAQARPMAATPKAPSVLKPKKKQPQKDGLREYAKTAGKGMI